MPSRLLNAGGRGLLAAVCAASVLAACGGGSGGGGSAPVATSASPVPQATATPSPVPTATPASTIYQWHLPAYTALNDWQWNLPSYMPPPRVPADNPMTPAKVELGRHLFYDQRLSGNGSMSCASCHHQDKAFSDGRALPVGITGMVHPRNSMALVNLAWNATHTWANPVLTSLEKQIPNPLFGETPVEMGVNEDSVQLILQRLAADPRYPGMFAAAFPGDGTINWQHIMQSITAFERTLISVNSKYDQYLQGKAQFTPSELNGLQVFKNAQCSQCHKEPNFNDQFVSSITQKLMLRYHNKGLYNIGGKGDYPEGNQGQVELTGNLADMGRFRTPTLRNIEKTAPYGHDGSIATLEEAIDIFTSGGRNIKSGPHAGDGRLNPYKSPYLIDRQLSAQDKADLLAFLKTLTDETFLTNPQLANPFTQQP